MRSCNIMFAAVVSFCVLSATSNRSLVAKAAMPNKTQTALAIITSARVKPFSTFGLRGLWDSGLHLAIMTIISNLGAISALFGTLPSKRLDRDSAGVASPKAACDRRIDNRDLANIMAAHVG